MEEEDLVRRPCLPALLESFTAALDAVFVDEEEDDALLLFALLEGETNRVAELPGPAAGSKMVVV